MLKRNSININIDHLSSWYAATGFTLPRTQGELRHFDKLYANFEHELTGNELNVNDIFDNVEQIDVSESPVIVDIEVKPLRMAARSFKDLPEDIRDQMIANQLKFEK